MALPDSRPAAAHDDALDGYSSASPILASLPQGVSLPGAALPQGALARLPQLHQETRAAARQARLLARAVPAAGVLLALGTCAALWGGGGMAPTFAWSLLILLGIGAILRNHLRGASRPFAAGLAPAVADLRATLLYMGFAWGAGAFLALTPSPALLALFAGLPALAMALLLPDMAAVLAFAGPVTVLTLVAAILRSASLADAALILLPQGAVAVLLLRYRVRGRSTPAGLALR